ncbi:DUF4148 domain-containing protein [Burkholderia perseverans]|uniref:DUF4148 domain-containing protein n=1 Tax=Burkholderia perseverans TaxID=2615214 RepID=UPI001FEF607E|nr:DUF4148 domain-containing protein [Burkholderia perseverans]
MRISSCLPLLLAAAAPFAQAQTADPQPVPEKTHAQVVAELVQAYRDGTIPTTDGDYPAGDQTVQMNRARFQAAPPPWAQGR